MLYSWDLEKNRELGSLCLGSFILTQSSCGTDPLVHHGRHFGRTVHAMCTVQALLNNGLLRMGELAEEPEETFSHELVLFVFTVITNH